MLKNLEKKEKVLAITRIIIFFVVVVALIVITLIAIPYVGKLGDKNERLAFKTYIDSQGFKGVLIMLGLQILQIIVAVIPGQPMEIISGMCYGVWGGMALCLVGIFISTAIIFFTVRKVGDTFIQLFFSKEKIEKIKSSKTFKNSKKFELLLFIMFVIPVIPKDIFIYVAGLAPINTRRFLFISTIARIPGLFITVYAGDNLTQGNFLIAVAMVVVFVIVGILGYYFGNKATEKIEEKS